MDLWFGELPCAIHPVGFAKYADKQKILTLSTPVYWETFNSCGNLNNLVNLVFSTSVAFAFFVYYAIK